MQTRLVLARLSVFLAVFSWATNWIVGRAMRTELGPVTMGFWRWTIALIIILPFCLSEITLKWSEIKIMKWRLATLGLLGAVAFNTFLYVGLQFTQASNASLLNTTIPTFIMLITFLAYREPIQRLQIVGLLISSVGVGFIIFRGDFSLLAKFSLNRGDVWVLAAMVLVSTYTVLLRSWTTTLSPLTFLATILIFSIPILTPFYIWELLSQGGFDLSRETLMTLIYYGTIPSILGYLLWNYGVDVLGPIKAGMFVHLMPVLTIGLSVLLLNESLYAYHGVGALLIFLGISCANRNQ